MVGRFLENDMPKLHSDQIITTYLLQNQKNINIPVVIIQPLVMNLNILNK